MPCLHIFLYFCNVINNDMRKYLCFIVFVLFAVFSAKAQNDTILFSTHGGFYDDVFALEMFNYNPQNHIRYTVNGNRPTAQSSIYVEPLVLDERNYSHSDIYTIVNCPEPDFFLPDSVRHCIVIRAAVFDANDSCVSKVVTNSFFIKALGCDTHGLPAISLCADSLDLFGYEEGILVPGVNFNPQNPYATGNYFMKGLEWERLCNFEFFEADDNAGVNQQLGLRTHGKQSRWRSHKGYSLYAREEYGKKRIRYKFFETSPMEKFKHLTLRPYSSSWNGAGCEDYLCNRIVQPLDVEALSSRPCVLFINGEYWGVYYLEEKPDEHYLKDYLGVNEDSVTIIKEWYEVECGSGDNFDALFAWMEQADLSDEEQYDYAAAHIDIDNFIDYFIFEIYAMNHDWPATNLRCWQEGEGKWRWIFYDGDGCFFDHNNFDAFANATYEGEPAWPTSGRATLFFRRLLENDGFKLQFCDRFNQLAATTFAYHNTKPYFDYIYQTLQPEVPNQVERFNFPHAITTWENYCMPVVHNFLMLRPEQVIGELNEYLSVEEPSVFAAQCFPNPFTNEIRIGIDSKDFGAKGVAIYDMMGRKVYDQPCCLTKGHNEITLYPNLTPGVYVLKLGSLSIKVVRQ